MSSPIFFFWIVHWPSSNSCDLVKSQMQNCAIIGHFRILYNENRKAKFVPVCSRWGRVPCSTPVLPVASLWRDHQQSNTTNIVPCNTCLWSNAQVYKRKTNETGRQLDVSNLSAKTWVILFDFTLKMLCKFTCGSLFTWTHFVWSHCHIQI